MWKLLRRWRAITSQNRSDWSVVWLYKAASSVTVKQFSQIFLSLIQGSRWPKSSLILSDLKSQAGSGWKSRIMIPKTGNEKPSLKISCLENPTKGHHNQLWLDGKIYTWKMILFGLVEHHRFHWAIADSPSWSLPHFLFTYFPCKTFTSCFSLKAAYTSNNVITIRNKNGETNMETMQNSRTPGHRITMRAFFGLLFNIFHKRLPEEAVGACFCRPPYIYASALAYMEQTAQREGTTRR